MTHYVCTGDCGGVSDHAQACEAKSCLRFGKPLTPCNCEDGQHKEAFDKAKMEKQEQKV